MILDSFNRCDQSRFSPQILRCLSAVFAQVFTEYFLFGRHPFRDCAHDARDVEEVPVIHVVGKIVAAPCAAAHGKRKRQTVVEAAAGRKTMRLIDDDAADGKLLPQAQRVFVVGCMNPDRMPRALITETRSAYVTSESQNPR